jgi:hypothetical protein
VADVNVGGGVVDAVVNFVVDGARQAIEGPRNLRDNERAALESAGWILPPGTRGEGKIRLIVKDSRGRTLVNPPYYNPATGEYLSRSEAVALAGRIRAERAQLDRLPPIPPGYDSVTIPALPLPPSIPPFIAGAARALPWPVLGGPIGAGVLMWPTAAGTGSDLRDLYGMPKPKTPGGRRRGRRRRTRARPRAAPGRGNPFPAAAPGRGGPVTIRTRPAAPAAPPAVRVAQKVWKPSKANLPPVKIPKQRIELPRPAGIPQSPAQKVLSKAGAIAKSPWFNVASTIINSPFFSLFQPKARAPSLGQIVLPGTGSQPGLNLNPLTALNAPGLQYSRALAANPAAVSEQDCSCRPVRKKRKGKPCKNPVTSRRSFKRNGSKFVTTTKEIKCQASSRKKPSLRPVG